MAVLSDAWIGSNPINYSGLLKDRWLAGIRAQFSSAIVLWRLATKTGRYTDTSGERAIMDLEIGRNAGGGNVGRGGRFPDPGRSQYTKIPINFRIRYDSIAVDGTLEQMTRDASGAFGRQLLLQTKSVMRDALHDNNRQIQGDGSGRVAIVTDISQGASGILRVREVFDVANQGTVLRSMQVGAVYALVKAVSGGNPGATAFVVDLAGIDHWACTAVDPRAKEVTLQPVNIGATTDAYGTGTANLTGGGTPVAVGDVLVRCHLRDQASTVTLPETGYFGQSTGRGQVEFMGIAGIISDANPFNHYDAAGNPDATIDPGNPGNPLQGFSVANGLWRANVDDPGALRSLDPLMIRAMMDSMETEGDGQLSFLYSGHGAVRAYEALGIPLKRFSNTTSMDLGTNPLDYSGTPWVRDRDATPGRIYGIDTAALFFLWLSDYYWVSMDGLVLRKVEGYEKYAATLALKGEYAVRRRNAHGLLGSIREA